jgi:L-fucose mutarotase
MAIVPGDKAKTDIWPKYRKIIDKSSEKCGSFKFMERQAFYERAKSAYAIVATSESAPYANLILKKGVIRL